MPCNPMSTWYALQQRKMIHNRKIIRNQFCNLKIQNRGIYLKESGYVIYKFQPQCYRPCRHDYENNLKTIYVYVTHLNQERPWQTKPKKSQIMNISQGHSGTKVRYVNRACFPKEKHQKIHTKMGEIHMNFFFRFGPFFGLVCRGDS